MEREKDASAVKAQQSATAAAAADKAHDTSCSPCSTSTRVCCCLGPKQLHPALIKSVERDSILAVKTPFGNLGWQGWYLSSPLLIPLLLVCQPSHLGPTLLSLTHPWLLLSSLTPFSPPLPPVDRLGLCFILHTPAAPSMPAKQAGLSQLSECGVWRFEGAPLCRWCC